LNTTGQLGDGTTTDRASPVQVMAAPDVPLVDVAEVVAGELHSCARKTDGTVWCWGDNMDGRLGSGGAPLQSLTPVQALTGAATPLVGVQGIWLGAAHVVAWGGGGELYSWGYNVSGQLGNGTYANESYATPVSISNVVSASAACCHTCVMTETGVAYCFGRGASGELGNGTLMGGPSPTSVLEMVNGPALSLRQVAVGDAHTCGRRDDASVWCWGDNSSGEAGIGSTAADIVSPSRVTLDSGAIDIAAGNNHMCAAHADGVSCWGRNSNGQLGNGSFSTSSVPVRVSFDCPES
jgi:alpha-tubulin suppressor-like RCC1 family protein